MNTRFNKIFHKRNRIVIGAIHLPPLLGYAGFPGINQAIKNALFDLKAFEDGGVDGVLFENNYDIPHSPTAGPETIAAMAVVGEKIRTATNLPVGVNVLWNDFRSSLTLAKLLDLQFVRVPVFTDKVRTECGIINGEARQIIKLRKKIGAEKVALLTDIHVKHAKLLSRHNLVTSAKLAIKNGADAVILTGQWTGQAPDSQDLKQLKHALGGFPILAGSGVNNNNASFIFNYVNGGIVSTSLKHGAKRTGEVNVKTYQQRIVVDKVRKLVSTIDKKK